MGQGAQGQEGGREGRGELDLGDRLKKSTCVYDLKMKKINYKRRVAIAKLTSPCVSYMHLQYPSIQRQESNFS